MKRWMILLLILTLILSFGFASLEAVHDCHDGAECPICKIIAVLSSIFAVVAVCFVLILCFSLVGYLVFRLTNRENHSSTLIDLGVKLSN